MRPTTLVLLSLSVDRYADDGWKAIGRSTVNRISA